MPAINTAEKLFSVRGLVAVITGGGSGLGLYAARALDAGGAKAVYIIGRRETALVQAAKTGTNGSIKPIVGDVSDKASLTKVADQIRREQGYVNFLFANAGIGGPSDRGEIEKTTKGSVEELQQALWKSEPDDYTKVLHTNVTGAYFTAVAFLNLLEAGNKQRNVPQDSSILITSSGAGYNRYISASFAYSTSKAAVNHLVKSMSTLFAQQHVKVRVNAVNPGFYPSEMTQGFMDENDKYRGLEDHDGQYEGARTLPHVLCPTERTGSEQDFAGVILFLASPAGAYINGETLLTDGGRVAQYPSSY